MKRIIFLAFVMVFAFTLNAYSEGLKIAVVDLQKALNESEGGKNAKKSLEELIKSKQKLIDEKGKEIEQMKTELDKQSAVLSKEALQKKQDELDKKIREYKRYVQDSQEEVKKKENELTAEILKDLARIIEKIGQEEGYSLILEKAKGVVLFNSEAVDITNRVIERYNKELKGQQ
ncbi:MAG: OmpH family outer membrane protein [Nitrospirae bacterium]|nr:MAG: OmpH family outer membrane protein [Nitrospirota bacterium]